MQKTQVWSLLNGTHSSTLAWKLPWAEEPGGLQSMGSLRVRHDWETYLPFTFHFSLSCIGEGNGNPFQCSCLENPRDGGAWWAAVYGVSQSLTQLKWLTQLSSSSSSQEDPTCAEQLSPGATAVGPVLRARAWQQQEQPQGEGCAPQLQGGTHSLQPDKSLCSSEDPAQPKAIKRMLRKN